MYLDAGRYDDAISSSKAWLRIRPHSIAARDIICTAYLQKGEIRKALETATEMVRLAPIDPIGYYKRGVLHQHDGDWRNAIQQFMFAAEMSPAGSLEHQEAEAAVEAIDQYQVRAIMSLASQDLIFKTHLMRNVDEASRDRGFYISPSATAFIEHILAYHSPEALDCADETKLNVFSYRPQRYN
jgi:tetratricopeptide (TPR) repeat protein